MTTLEEQRDEERDARITAQREAKQTDQARIEAERALAVAETRTEAAQQQAEERAKALQEERQARQQDAQGHRQALAEQRDEYRERLAALEKQLQDAHQRAQEAEKGRTKAEVQGEALAARMEALESRRYQDREDEQGQLPLGE